MCRPKKVVMHSFIKHFLFFICFFLPNIVTAGPTPINIQISWDYKKIPAEMKIFELGTKPVNLWQMGTGKTLQELPISSEINQSTLILMPGMKKTFALVYHNTTDKPLRFFAAPHQAMPVEHSLGFKFHCLCINHIYDVPPGEYWYRVVEFHLAKEFVGGNFNVTHTLVPVEEGRKNPGET